MGEYDRVRSVSQRRTYSSCGVKWLLHYHQGFRQRQKPGRFAFGDAMQQTADAIVAQAGAMTAEAAVAYFDALWALLLLVPMLRAAVGQPSEELSWPKTKSWAWYRERGRGLAAKAAVELPLHIRPNGIHLTNQPIRFKIEGVEELAFPDLVTHVQRQIVTYGPDGPQRAWDDDATALTVLDYKAVAYAYDPLKPELDEQLIEYAMGCAALGLPPIEQVGFCVFVTTAQPQIQWLLVPVPSADVIAAHVARVVTTDRLIREGVFTRNPGACYEYGGCEYQPICFASQAFRREAELVQDPDKVRDERELAADWSE